MKTFKLLMIGCALSTLTLGAEVVDLSQRAAWAYASKTAEFKDGKIISPSRAMLIGKKKFTVDPSKTYTISMDVKRLKADAQNPSILIGYEGMDAKGRPVPVYAYQTRPATFTEVTAPAKKGDTVIRIKDGSKWRTGNDIYVILNAKEDFSDIPNSRYAVTGIQKITKEGADYVVALKKPIRYDIAAGTKVRQHLPNGYFYVSTNNKINTDKVYNLKYETKGFNNYGGMNGKEFPRGVAQWRVILLLNWGGSKAGMEVSNVKFSVK